MHVGSVMVFDPPSDGFDYDRLVQLISTRIAFVPALPAADPAGPRPAGQPGVGRRRELRRDLPRAPLRPPAAGQRRAAAGVRRPDPAARRSTATARCGRSTSSRGWPRAGSRSSPSRTRRSSTASTPSTSRTSSSTATRRPRDWSPTPGAPRREPSDVELLTGALVDAVRRPSEVVENIRGGIVDVKAVGTRALTAAGDVVSTLARTAARPAPHSPLNAPVGEARRYVMIGTDLEDYRKVRSRLAAGQLRRRRLDQRRRARHHLRRLPHLAADPWRVRPLRARRCGRWCR